MIEWTMLLDDAPTPEHLCEEFERRPRGRGLGDGEFVLDLPAEPTPGVAHHRDREAPFAVDEADSPLLDAWPFLLIVRTARIFTSHAHVIRRCRDTWASTVGYTGFPAYSQLHSAGSLLRGAVLCCTQRGSTLGPL